MNLDWTELVRTEGFWGPWGSLIGFTCEQASPDSVTVTWTATPEHTQPMGLVNGGVHATVTETVGSVAALLWRLSQASDDVDPRNPRTWPGVVGVSNTTEFFRPMHAGDTARTTCTPIHRGRTQQLWLLETVGAQGKLLARGQLRLQNL